MSDLFEQDATPVEAPKFEDLVGEGKKFSSPDELARAKMEADAFIEKLKNETAEMRAELQSRLTLEELMEKIPSAQPAPSANHDQLNAPDKGQEPGSPEPVVDITETVKSLLAEEKQKERREANIEKTRQGLKERFGPDYNQKLATIAEQLEVSKEFLTGMAATSPSGFLKLIDSVAAPDDKRPMATPPASSTNPAAAAASGVKKNNAYYRELRRTDPKRYFSRQVQNEMHQQVMKMGAAFYE